MPITLFSGLPGHGKTLRCLWVVEQLRKQSNREVYFWNIKELTLPWKPLTDPKNWMEVPDGSILVIDEAWEVFPKRGPSAPVPKHVELLATHRHRGIDIFIVSQHAANQIDHFVRGLIDGHEHTIRLMGMERSRVHKWNGLGDPSDYFSLQKAVTEQWTYPKEVYGWYKSAEIHTVKRKIPWKPFLTIAAGVLAIAGLGYAAYSTLFGNVSASVDAFKGADAAVSPDGKITNPVRPPNRAKPVTADQFVPTMQAAPFSAPFYQPAVKVTAAPQIAGCGALVINDDVKCDCFSQQGSKIEMSIRMCLQYVKNGSFRFDRGDDYYPKYEAYVPPLAEPVDDAPAHEAKPGGGASQPSEAQSHS